MTEDEFKNLEEGDLIRKVKCQLPYKLIMHYGDHLTARQTITIESAFISAWGTANQTFDSEHRPQIGLHIQRATDDRRDAKYRVIKVTSVHTVAEALTDLNIPKSEIGEWELVQRN